MSDEPFGRQPFPVDVIINGHPIDVHFWMTHFKTAAEYKGDVVQDDRTVGNKFRIYPRTVND